MKTDTIEKIALQLIDKNDTKAKEIINSEYPFEVSKRPKRGVTDKIKFKQCIKDGCIDRYSGERLVNPGILKVISYYIIKNNWTLEQLQWALHPPGNIKEWDGLTQLFISLVESDKQLLNDSYIKKWYLLSKKEDL